MSEELLNIPPGNGCDECGVVNTTAYRHGGTCSKQTVEQAIENYRALLATAQAQSSRNQGARQRLAELVTFWKGKFLMVAQENNALRKKLAQTSPDAGGE
jgi:hypothetical protein